MARPAIEPDQDAANLIRAALAGGLRGLRAQPQNVGEAHARHGPESELHEIAPPNSRTIGVQVAHGISGFEGELTRRFQWLKMNSAEFISAHITSSVPVFRVAPSALKAASAPRTSSLVGKRP